MQPSGIASADVLMEGIDVSPYFKGLLGVNTPLGIEIIQGNSGYSVLTFHKCKLANHLWDKGNQFDNKLYII